MYTNTPAYGGSDVYISYLKEWSLARAFFVNQENVTTTAKIKLSNVSKTLNLND